MVEEGKKSPDVTVPEEFTFYRNRDYLAVRLNEAYVEYEKAAAAVNRMGKGGLAIPQPQAQKAVMTLQLEADNLRTQCLAIVAEATIDSRDVLYAVVSELRKINARYDGISSSMGAGTPSEYAQCAPEPWKHPLDTVSDSFAVHEASGQWPAPLCPACNQAMEVEKWTDDGKPEMWICSPIDSDHFKEHSSPVGVSEKDVQRCRVCRCIETFPCARSVVNGPVETCHWFEKNLCSACKEEAEAVCEFFVPHGFGRAPLCENDEVISGRKECEHYDDTDKSCMKARLSLKQLHPELHEQIKEELDKVDEKDGAGEKLVHGVLTVEHGKVDEKDGAEEKVAQEEKKDGELIVAEVEVALNCPVCGSRFSKITGIPGELECYCDKCKKSYWPEKAGEAGKDGES